MRVARPLAVVTVAGLAIGLAFGLGLVDLVRDQERLSSTVQEAGPLGPLLFLGLMILLVPLNVPGVVFVVPATLLFGTVGGVALSLAGGFIASAIGVIGARSLGRTALERRLPPRVRRFEERLAERGFWAVVAIRTFTYLLQPADWLIGLSGMRLRTALAGTFVGLIPPTLVVALGGGAALGRVL